VHTTDGRALLDLATGFGAAFLGHAQPDITAKLREQAGRLLSCGRQPTEGQPRVEALLSALLPPGLRPAGLYSTGMEVAEFALRVAATHTQRGEFAAFAQSMHGKSAMTAALCWPNAPVQPGNTHVLPFVSQAPEPQILAELERLLATRRIAALLVEPIQGSNAAHEASAGFYRRAIDLCHEHGTLCVFDEILTGLHRTGARFYFELLQRTPDVVLFAKSLGNGFPVSSIAVADRIRIVPACLPGSTFSGNPLALSAVEATLTVMSAIPMAQLVANIERIVQSTLEPLRREGVTVRGRGAFWCLEFDQRERMQRVHAAIAEAGILATGADRFIRLLPAATIEPRTLEDACGKIARACRR
jgi:acetylornithine/succinyldiaminopimelate/putrescine aminotransferase